MKIIKYGKSKPQYGRCSYCQAEVEITYADLLKAGDFIRCPVCGTSAIHDFRTNNGDWKCYEGDYRILLPWPK